MSLYITLYISHTFLIQQPLALTAVKSKNCHKITTSKFQVFLLITAHFYVQLRTFMYDIFWLLFYFKPGQSEMSEHQDMSL